jgi:ABC-type transport system involved in multi-copper enzyme maturation permease subunit
MKDKKERKEKIKELKNNKKVKMTILLTKMTLYFMLITLCFKYSIIIANNIIFGLQQIVLWGTDNMTKLVFGILVAIVTIIMFRKSK